MCWRRSTYIDGVASAHEVEFGDGEIRGRRFVRIARIGVRSHIMKKCFKWHVRAVGLTQPTLSASFVRIILRRTTNASAATFLHHGG
jgi:hypothetical protein